MTAPEKKLPVTDHDSSHSNLPLKSKIPVLHKPTRSVLPTNAPQTLPAGGCSVSMQSTARTGNSSSHGNTRRTTPATQSLSIGRSASTTQIEVQRTPRVKGKQTVLSYRKLSQENKQLRNNLAALRATLSEVELDRGEERSSLTSEIELLSKRLAESNTSVTQLSEQSIRKGERVDRLISVMERIGIDPVSGEEVVSEDERKQARVAAMEKTRFLADRLTRQMERCDQMCAEMEEKMEEMLALAPLDDEARLSPGPGDTDSLFEQSLDVSITAPVITEQPVTL